MRDELEKIRDIMKSAAFDSDEYKEAIRKHASILEASHKAEHLISTRDVDLKGHAWWKDSYKAYGELHSAVYSMIKGDTPDITCKHCGEPVVLSVEEDLITTESECSFPHGVPEEYSIDIDVPSGKIVFANDLRDFYELAPDFDINTLEGQMKSAMFYGEQGLGFGHIGNSCPSLFQDGRSIHIGNQGYNDVDEVVDPIPGKRVGGVTTDVWAFSLADYDDLKERGWDDESRAYYPTLKTKPDKYRLTIYPRVNREEYDPKTKEVFATIKRVE